MFQSNLAGLEQKKTQFENFFIVDTFFYLLLQWVKKLY